MASPVSLEPLDFEEAGEDPEEWLIGQADTLAAPPRVVMTNLYILQSLSSWSIRMSDYCIAVFLAASFPNTLFYISVYSFVRSCAAVIFSSAIGSIMDRTNRLVGLQWATGEESLITFSISRGWYHYQGTL